MCFQELQYRLGLSHIQLTFFSYLKDSFAIASKSNTTAFLQAKYNNFILDYKYKSQAQP